MTQDRQPTSSEDTLTAVEEIYAEINKAWRELRRTDRIVQDLGFDSLGSVELLVALEKRFGVTLLGDQRVAGVRTVGELVDALEVVVHGASRHS